MFVDTHCHLSMMISKKVDELFSFEQLDSIGKIEDEAYQNNVKKIINISVNLPDSLNAIAIAKKSNFVYTSVGIHPCDCSGQWKTDFKEIEKLLLNRQENKIVAIGETGLDFYHKPFYRQRQIDAFKSHIECSIKHDLPLSIHVRESVAEVLHVLNSYKNEIKGVLHCFCNSKNVADIFIEWGMYLGIGGVLTYPKNQWLRDVLKNVSLEHVVLETDAPFLPPQQFRGKQNHPKYIPLIAQAVAEVKEIDVQKVEDVTTANAKKLFKI